MADDPDSFDFALGILELVGQEFENAAIVGIGRVPFFSVSFGLPHPKLDLHVVEQVASVPEIRVDGDDSELGVLGMVDAVCTIMHPGFVGSFGRDPIVLLPQRRDVIPVPRSSLVSTSRIQGDELTVAGPGFQAWYVGNRCRLSTH